MMTTLLLISAMLFSPPQTIRVEVNGAPASYDGTPPQMVRGRVLVPVRGTFDQMGATVTWDNTSQTVTASHDGSTITLKIGDNVAMKNGDPITLDVPPQIIEGRTMIPLRFIGEALGAKVSWDGIGRLVSIDTIARR